VPHTVQIKHKGKKKYLNGVLTPIQSVPLVGAKTPDGVQQYNTLVFLLILNLNVYMKATEQTDEVFKENV
jgi:hypothetical protein